MTTGTEPTADERKEPAPVSVIIPVWNRPESLARALESLSRQTVPPADVVVVDDGSREPVTLPAMADTHFPVRLIRRPENGGPAAARNSGLAAAGYEWIAFLDSDDTWLPDSLELRWREIRRRQNAAPNGKVVYGCAWIDYGEDGTALRTRTPRASADPRDFAAGCWFSPGTCVILNRDAALAAAGPMDEGLRRLEDLDWFLRLALAGFRLEVIPVVGAAITIRRSFTPAQAARVAEAAAAIERKWKPQLTDRQLADRLKAYLFLEEAAAWWFSSRYASALLAIARSMLALPRTRLQLSPGWDFGPAPAKPK